jgi:hypothetical protein
MAIKTMTLVGCLVAVALVLSGCGAAPTPTVGVSALGFGAAPWQNGSTADYHWQDDSSGVEIGTSHYSFGLDLGVWTITEKDTISGLDQLIEMRIDAASLAPLGETKVITTASSTVDLATTYENSKLSITAVVNGQTQSASLAVPANAVDNDQLLMTLRALPFGEGVKASYVVLVAQNALKVDTTVQVVGQESITVPAGTFDTWHVQITDGQSKQDAWYQVDTPQNLVQYDNGATRMVLEP